MKWLVILSSCYHVVAANNFMAGLIVTVSLVLFAISRRVD